ncbi:hypothetical protein PIB30_087842 [Stylosanthes scabra]|uniref:Uncharacterized protein n=1 Tax=Stylosanthes scabra TaxID=79078 RepID=A0ABU6XTC3_9FABA|nr:hypothetical protein [Stylosanthes scabra]
MFAPWCIRTKVVGVYAPVLKLGLQVAENGGYAHIESLCIRIWGIEKGIEKAKEGIGSKGITKEGQEEENRAPRSRTVPSCVRTCPWERFGKKSTQTCAITCCTHKVKAAHLLTVRPHGVSCDPTVPSGRIKIKAKIGISNFRARAKPL